MTTISLTCEDLRVLAFARGWSPDREGPTQLELLRLRVMEVGVELVIIGERGVWVIGVDGRIGHVDRLAGDVPLSATMMQARRGDGAYLIEDGKVVRIAHDGSLVDAITGAGEMLAMRRMDMPSTLDSTMPHGMFAPVFESPESTMQNMEWAS